MTDRFNTLTVVLEVATRDDDAEQILSAIRMVKGVLSVSGDVASGQEYMAIERARSELGSKLWGVLYPKSKG